MAGCTPVFGAVALLIGGAGIAIAQTSPETTSRTIELPTMEVTPVPRTIGGTTRSTGPCVAVDIVGHKAGHLDCVAEKLDAVAKAAQRQAKEPSGIAIPQAISPGVVTGVANPTATRNRMGNTYGTSVKPQRPAQPVYTSPIGRRP